MHVVNLIANALRKQKQCDLILGGKMETCCLTGEITMCVPRKKILGKSFTNIDRLMAPASKYIGEDAAIVLKYRPERSSWYVDENIFMPLDRKGVRNMVFQKEMPRLWAGYATTSYKKHGSLMASLNKPGQRIWLFEMKYVDCSDYENMMLIWNRLNQALKDNISRPIIESLDTGTYVIEKIGIKKYMDFVKWARKYYLSALYAFMTYLLPSMEERKEVNEGL